MYIELSTFVVEKIIENTMPTNKNASIRYQALDKCFRDFHHRYYINDLIAKCEEALADFNGIGGVSRRQVFEDIRYMESDAGWNIPLARMKDGKKVYYRYDKPNFTINGQPLTDEETCLLEETILTLKRFHGIPNNEWIDEVISNIECRFNLNGDKQAVVGFDQNGRLKGLHYLSPIINATINKQILHITYKSYKENAEERLMVIHPYYVKQYNNRWFLMALDNEKGYIVNLALDRILSLETIENGPFIPNNEIDFDNYFNDVIGVTIPNEDVPKERIILRLDARQYAYVVAKPLHISQQIVDETRHLVSIEVKPNYELDYHILSLGPDVEVVAPASYRQHIKEKLEECLKKYN